MIDQLGIATTSWDSTDYCVPNFGPPEARTSYFFLMSLHMYRYAKNSFPLPISSLSVLCTNQARHLPSVVHSIRLIPLCTLSSQCQFQTLSHRPWPVCNATFSSTPICIFSACLLLHHLKLGIINYRWQEIMLMCNAFLNGT